MQTEAFCVFKKKKGKKNTKKSKENLTRDGCKNYTHAQRPDTTPIPQSWAGIPLSGLGTDKFFLFFFFFRVHSSSLVLVHRSLNMQARGRNDVPFLFLFHLKLFTAVHWNLLIIHVYVCFFSAISSVDLCWPNWWVLLLINLYLSHFVCMCIVRL